MIGLVFLTRFYILPLSAISNQCAVFGTSFREIILLNCLTYEFLAGSWNFWNWHSDIHRRDVEILHIHEIIFSTIDKPKLLAQVRLRTPILVLFMWLAFGLKINDIPCYFFESKHTLLLEFECLFTLLFVAICFAVWSWTEHPWSSCLLNNWWLLFGCICCWWLGYRGKLPENGCVVLACLSMYIWSMFWRNCFSLKETTATI